MAAVTKREITTVTRAYDETLRVTGAAPNRQIGLSLFEQTFVDADLTASKITFEHGLNRFPLHVTVVDSSRTVCVMPTRFVDSLDADSDDHVTLDFTGWGTLVGTYKILVSP